MGPTTKETLPIINSYHLTTPFMNTNSGFARWAYATRDHRHYFVKEFLSPVYPQDDCGMQMDAILRKRKICDEYYSRKSRLYSAINEDKSGNIVKINEFFRYKTKYYIVTDKIDMAHRTIHEIARFPEESKLLLLKILAYCLKNLHEKSIVHADLKLDNILIKQTSTGNFTAKLIDFDSSFFTGEQPRNCDEIQGDQVYIAPETARAIMGENVELTQKIDVFALGLLFHQYYTGFLPTFDPSYSSAYEALLDGGTLCVDGMIPGPIANLICHMLELDSEKRFDIEAVFQELQQMTKMAEKPPEKLEKSEVTPEPKPELPSKKDDTLWNRPIDF
jgi:serine/threonine protein kinase